jgi:hypothetical protein
MEFSPSQSAQQPGGMITGMRPWRGANKAFAVVVMMAKDLIRSPAGDRQSFHNPASCAPHEHVQGFALSKRHISRL